MCSGGVKALPRYPPAAKSGPIILAAEFIRVAKRAAKQQGT